MATDIVTAESRSPIREGTRRAWATLAQAGKTPSVRQVHDLTGGSYNLVADECRQLRREIEASGVEGNPAQAPEEPHEDTPPSPDSPQGLQAIVEHPETPGGHAVVALVADDADDRLLDVPAAEAAVAEAVAAQQAASQQHERLAAAVRQAQHDHDAQQQEVRTLERRMLNEELVQEQLVEARQARLLMHLRIGDVETLLHEARATVHQAEAALTLAAQRLEVTRYNTMAFGRAPLLAHIDAALTGLETALQELMTHDATQHALAGELAFGDLLSATPLFAPHERHASHFGLVNLWLYSRLAPLIPAPERAIKHPVLVSSLPEVDVASTQLSWSAYAQASDPERRILIRLVPSEDPRAVNAIPLVRYGLPAVLSTLQPVAVSPGQWRAIRQNHPNVQMVDEAPSGRRAMPLQMEPFPDGSDQPMFDLSQNDYDLDAMDDQGDVQ